MPFSTGDLARVRRYFGYPANPQINSNIQTRLDAVQALGEAEVTIAVTNLRRLDEISDELRKQPSNRIQLISEAKQLIGELSIQLSLIVWCDIYSSRSSSRVVRG